MGFAGLAYLFRQALQMERMRGEKSELRTHRQDLQRRQLERATYYLLREIIVGHADKCKGDLQHYHRIQTY
jgi:hypothetical protein